jgi:hypothetical protein
MTMRLLAMAFLVIAIPAYGQTKPAPPPPQTGAPQKPATPAKAATRTPPGENPNAIGVRGFGTFGAVTFQARDSFDAILESHDGLTYGGGVQVLLPWGLYAEVGAWRFSGSGERAFVGPNQEVFRLGIPVDVTVTPVEITGGWRYRHCPAPPRPPGKPRAAPPVRTAARPCVPKLIPYAGGGLTLLKYSETSEFADNSEQVDERFSGYHLVGGVEYRVLRWLAMGGEVAWSSVPDALEGGVAAAFDEHNLGGTTFRVKVSVGR